MLKIRRPLGRLIFNMGIAIPGKTVFLIETAPSSPCISVLCVNARQATFSEINLHTFGPRLSRSSSPCSAGNRKVCDIVYTGCGTLHLSIQFEPPTAVIFLMPSLWNIEAKAGCPAMNPHKIPWLFPDISLTILWFSLTMRHIIGISLLS